MADNLLRRYFWLIDTIRSYGPMTYEDINAFWRRSYLNEYGQDLPKKTFHNHIEAIWLSLGVEIACNRKTGYRYYIKEEEKKDKWMSNLLDTITIQASIGNGTGMKGRIVDYDVRYEPKLPLLAQIINKRCVIHFRIFISFEQERKDPKMADYTDVDCKYSHFCPLGLVQVMRNWYVIGIFCKEGHQYRKFAAYRVADINDIDIMEGVVMPDYPESFSVKEYIANLTINRNEKYFNQNALLYSDLYAMGIIDTPLKLPVTE